MKPVVSIGVLLLFSSLSFANADSAAELSKFETLGKHFAAGTAPAVNDVLGWRTGRCYHADEPNEARGVILIGKYVSILGDTSGPNDGPLFPGTPNGGSSSALALSAASVTKYDSADRFDIITPSDRALIIKTEQSTQFKNLTVVLSENSMISRNELWNTKLMVRKFGSYLVSQLVRTADSGSEKTGQITPRCYFFKEVK